MNDPTDLGLMTMLFKGRVVEAKYLSQAVPIYQGNPLIEALPAIWSAEEFISRSAYYPSYNVTDRDLPPTTRLHLLGQLGALFVPLDDHVTLDRKIAIALRHGYRARNPLYTRFWTRLNASVTDVAQYKYKIHGQIMDTNGSMDEPDTYAFDNDEKFREYVHTTHSSLLSFAVIGMSGTGKTTALKTIISQYPQVIIHHQYEHRTFTHYQLVWLMLECPHNASVRQICFNFLAAVDDVLHTTYRRDYSIKGRAGESTLVQAMARVAAIHGLGILVIDEMQNLEIMKSGGEKKVLNFFTALNNVMGIPVVYAGTTKLQGILSRAMKTVRRASGMGQRIWDRLENNEHWRYFVDGFWFYQYTASETPLNDPICNALYEESQGIVDLAIKIYLLAQTRAILNTSRDPSKKITEALIRSVARDELQMAQPLITALRNGDQAAISRYDDLGRIDVNTKIDDAIVKLRGAETTIPLDVFRSQHPMRIRK